MLAERAKRSKPAQGPEPENWSGTSIDYNLELPHETRPA
jgi:hypothetical protein